MDIFQVLKLAISNILTSCDNRGFGSVAFPVLGAGIALRFPGRLVAMVLLEEVLEFKKNRASRTPFVVRVVIPPDDKASMEVQWKCIVAKTQTIHDGLKLSGI